MIRARIDPGSAFVAVGIFADDAPPPYLCRYVDAHPYSVGTITKHDPPLTGHYKDRVRKSDGVVIPGGPWTRHETREVTEADEQRVARFVVEGLVLRRVEEVTLERIGHAFGDTVPEVAAKSKYLISTARISAAIVTGCEYHGIRVTPGPLAVTWRARLAPLVREHGGDVAGPAIRGKGAALDPLLAALIQDWPANDTWTDKEVDHIRVTGGLALWGALPALPSAARKALGPRAPRDPDAAKRTPRGGKAGRYPKGARARANMSVEEAVRERAVARAAHARRFGGGADAACDCRTIDARGRRSPGSCKRTCAAVLAKQAG